MKKIMHIIKTNVDKILLMILIYLALGLFSKLTYLNLFFNERRIITFLTILAVFIFHLNKRIFFYFAFVCLLLSLPFLLLQKQMDAAGFGNLAYLYLILGTSFEFYKYRKSK